MKELEEHLEAIKALCQRFYVNELAVYEPSGKDSQTPPWSFVVRFEPLSQTLYAENYFALKFTLQEIIGHPVNLQEEQAIQNPFFKKMIDASKHILYGRQDEGMAV